MNHKVLLLAVVSVFLCGTVHAQKKSNKKITISGIVTDTNKSPVSGAMILVDKINTNIVTDSKGYYKVKVKPDAQKITIFSFSRRNGGCFDKWQECHQLHY